MLLNGKEVYLNEEEVNALKNGSLLFAVKLLKERTGLGLRDAKQVVDDYQSARNK